MPTPSDPYAPNSGLYFEPSEDDHANIDALQTILPGQIPGQPVSPDTIVPPPRTSGSAGGGGGSGGSGGGGDRAPLGGAGDDRTPPARDGTLAYRPVQRPPMAMLCVVNDGEANGEWLPLRADRTLIARNEGDIRIPHDSQISGRKHAEVVRTRQEDGTYRWHLADLDSTNGTFVRVARFALSPGTELLFGMTRYRFESGQTPPPPSSPPSSPSPPVSDGMQTAKPGVSPVRRPSPIADIARLVEVTAQGDGAKISLVRDEYRLGRDPAECAIVPQDDPFVSPRHARLYRAENGRWRVENDNSLNGVWVRLTQPLPVKVTCEFLLGEQRFILKVLGSRSGG